MSTSSRNKIHQTIIILIVILLCISAVIYLYALHYPNQQNKSFLNKYGWDVSGGGKIGNNSTNLSESYLNEEITMMLNGINCFTIASTVLYTVSIDSLLTVLQSFRNKK